MTLLDVPRADCDARQSPDNKASPKRRPLEPLDVRRARMSDDRDDDEYDADRHYYVPSSPNRGGLQAPPAASQSEPRSPRGTERRSKRLAAGANRPAPGSVSPRPAGKPTYTVNSPGVNHESFTFPVQRKSNYRAKLSVEDDDDRPHSCDAMIPETTKPILAVDHYHDCSMENVRSFVSGMEVRRCGGPVVGGRAGCSTEVLLDLMDEDVAEAAGRKNVRFAPVVRVCDQTSTISYCHLRHQSASSAPAALRGASCSLPRLPSGGCDGSGSQSPGSRGDKLNLTAVVDRYMVRCERQLRADDLHRFPPLRHRRS